MITEKIPASLKGKLSRWMIEPAPGVFLGNPTKRVRDEIWKIALEKRKNGRVLQIWSCPTPQGFDLREVGLSKRKMLEFEGWYLPAVSKSKPNNNKIM